MLKLRWTYTFASWLFTLCYKLFQSQILIFTLNILTTCFLTILFLNLNSPFDYHYENTPIQIYWKFHNQKTESFQIKILIFSIFLLKNIDCGYSLELPQRGSSKEYPQSVLSRNKKNNVQPCKPQFYYIKWGLRGAKLYRYVFVMPVGLFKYCWTSGKQCRPWSHTAICGIWSGSTQFS